MPADLPAFSGTVCPMCAFPAAKYRFCSDDCKDEGEPAAMNRPATNLTPHLHRTCERCGFEWLEQTYRQDARG